MAAPARSTALPDPVGHGGGGRRGAVRAGDGAGSVSLSPATVGNGASLLKSGPGVLFALPDNAVEGIRG